MPNQPIAKTNSEPHYVAPVPRRMRPGDGLITVHWTTSILEEAVLGSYWKWHSWYEFVFLANILHLVFICEVICSKKETPPVCVDPRVKPSRMLESRCSQVALFLCHTGNSTYSNVFIQCFYKNVFLRFSVFSRKCHKFLKNQLKTQFNHWYLSAFISLSHMPVIFMRC